jgi:hypothetical protein
MASLFPFSQKTAERLSAAPEPGGTHRWLAQAASGVSRTVTPERCFTFLRRCCDVHVAHRRVPDREIEAAVEFASGGGAPAAGAVTFGRQAIEWPAPNADVIARLLASVDPVFDGETSTGLRPADVLPLLFRPGELVCTGAESERAVVRPVEAAVADADGLQFICVNPMRGPAAMNHAGRASARCQNNVRGRRFLVAEFDDAALGKRGQAQLATALAEKAPLVMAVDSGGKSVHAWFYVEGMARRDQARFFAVACLLGADATRWDICGWLRMPGGTRVKADGTRARQRILYFKPGAIGVGSTEGACDHGPETQSA